MFCFMYRWSISGSLDAARPLSGRAARHAARCPNCAAFARRSEKIGRRLIHEASRAEAAAEASPALHDEILHRCRPAASAADHPRRALAGRWGRPVMAAAAAALILLAGAAAWLALRDHSPKSPPGDDPYPSHPIAWVADPPALAAESVSVLEAALAQTVGAEVLALRDESLAAADVLLAVLPLDVDPRRNGDVP